MTNCGAGTDIPPICTLWSPDGPAREPLSAMGWSAGTPRFITVMTLPPPTLIVVDLALIPPRAEAVSLLCWGCLSSVVAAASAWLADACGFRSRPKIPVNWLKSPANGLGPLSTYSDWPRFNLGIELALRSSGTILLEGGLELLWTFMRGKVGGFFVSSSCKFLFLS